MLCEACPGGPWTLVELVFLPVVFNLRDWWPGRRWIHCALLFFVFDSLPCGCGPWSGVHKNFVHKRPHCRLLCHWKWHFEISHFLKTFYKVRLMSGQRTSQKSRDGRSGSLRSGQNESRRYQKNGHTGLRFIGQGLVKIGLCATCPHSVIASLSAWSVLRLDVRVSCVQP